MYLVDTDILSAGAPGRRGRSAKLIDWMDARSDALFLSTVTVAEICSGIAKLERTVADARAASLDE